MSKNTHINKKINHLLKRVMLVSELYIYYLFFLFLRFISIFVKTKIKMEVMNFFVIAD